MNELVLKVKDIMPEAKDTITILLERVDGRPLEYRAGQFLTFLLVAEVRELMRSNFFSSMPGILPPSATPVIKLTNSPLPHHYFHHLLLHAQFVSPPSAV